MYRRLRLERLRLVRRLGRRGMLLTLIGAAWVMVGITAVAIPQDRFSSPGIGPDTILQVLDSAEINFMWLISGGLAVGIGLLHDRRVINKYEGLAWNAILTMPLVWMLCFVWSFATWLITHGEGGRANGLYGSIVWALISLVIMIIAGWPEEKGAPPPLLTGTSDDPEETEVKEN